ncbi:MAG TPA: DUF3592 domain-containing protein [Thermoanaerobaculia bacterium]|nr:DUF3592 domain-containing protein [Thermoanaerobaculia bacterium]
MRRALAVLLVLIGLAAGGLAYFLEERHVLFTDGAVATTGTVVDLVDVRTESTGAPVYRAIIEFRDAQGNAHRFQSRYAGSGSPWRIGQRFDMLYRPERPERAELKHEMPGMYGALALFAVLSLGAAGFVVFRDRPGAPPAGRPGRQR